MKWQKVTVKYESHDPETAVTLIGEVFTEFGAKGFIEESPVVDTDVDWAEDALPIAGYYAVSGFFPARHYGEAESTAFKRTIAGLNPAILQGFELFHSEVDEEDWAESWKAHFHPVKISDRIVVCPSWELYNARGDEIILMIDPGMAFGTGAHATTTLCVRMIERYLKPGMRFLDIGTGSGILMIAAAKLGAAGLTGVDSDPVAVEVAERNLVGNDIPAEDFELARGDLVQAIEGSFNMIVANILSEVICGLVPDIPPILSPDGFFIASGIIIEKESMVLETLARAGFEIIETQHLDGWTVIVAKT